MFDASGGIEEGKTSAAPYDSRRIELELIAQVGAYTREEQEQGTRLGTPEIGSRWSRLR